MPSNELPIPDDGYVPDVMLFAEVPGSRAMQGGHFVFRCESVLFEASDGAPDDAVGDLVMAPAPAHLQPCWADRTGTRAIAVFEVREVVSASEVRAVMALPLFSHS